MDFLALQERYADLLVRIGANVQPGQSLRLGGELAHADFIRLVAAAAYRAGARYVHVDWLDAPLTRARVLHSKPEFLGHLPNYEIERHHEMVDEQWARIALVGPEFPDLFDDLDPAPMRQISQTRVQKLRYYMQAQMANQIQWCVAGVPTPAWAQKVFPNLSVDQAMEQLWAVILHTVRADQPDPIAAWQEHDRRLQRITQFMAEQGVRSLHFLDPTPGPDGKPATDLHVGLTDYPVWLAASSTTPQDVRFLPNMPTEEIFTAPHNERTHGYVRTSRPAFPFERRVDEA